MTFDRAQARALLRRGELKKLLVTCVGWDNPRELRPFSVEVESAPFVLTPLAQKRGAVILACSATADGGVPDSSTRRSIESAVVERAREHVIVFSDRTGKTLVWQWVARAPGRPPALRERWLFLNRQTGEEILDCLSRITFTLDEEQSANLLLVTTRLQDAFDRNAITLDFYKQFAKHRAAFTKKVTGIAAGDERQWWASLTLNRLMCTYFLQRRGFLDQDPNYLNTRLRIVQEQRGDGKFFSFYRTFLQRLFHDGLGKSAVTRTKDLEDLLGRVPYLNGGLFEEHDIEAAHPDIDVPDEAFSAIFSFFERWRWELDDSPTVTGTEISPDLLGYIFENYVNQKQMGAYYTKEDITGYIATRTILPLLLDRARAGDPAAFDRLLTSTLLSDPDRYLPESLRHGVGLDLPVGITAGVSSTTRRGQWGERATADHTQLHETWREVVARRARVDELRALLRGGDVSKIDDLVSNNLDVSLLVEDMIGAAPAGLAERFWSTLLELRVLDPTVGSGAFLLGAARVLEAMYQASLARMDVIVGDAGDSRDPLVRSFRQTLADVANHPNRAHYVLKTVLVRNLYGVEISREAVEICKLRLFLKLVAQVHEPDLDRADMGIEPLPDLDANIRAGNALVGFTTIEEVETALTEHLDFEVRGPRIHALLDDLVNATKDFRELQMELAPNRSSIDAKRKLRDRLQPLKDLLDQLLADRYEVKPRKLQAWKSSHQPFHWVIELADVMTRGGFDVVVGNPPYIAARKVNYRPLNFETSTCPDIFAWVMERALRLLGSDGRSGLIVPLSLGFSKGFARLRKLLFREFRASWFSHYGRIPSALFAFDVRVRNTIHLGRKGAEPGELWTTRLHRWNEHARRALFGNVEYACFDPALWGGRIPKVGRQPLASALEKLLATQPRVKEYRPRRSSSSTAPLHFKRTAYNWLTFCRDLPPCYDEKTGSEIEHTKFAPIHFGATTDRDAALLVLNSKLAFAYWCIVGDDFDVTAWNVDELPVPLDKFPIKELTALVPRLERAMSNAVQFKLNAGRRVGTYCLRRCRDVTDEVDRIVAKRIGLDKAWDEIELLCAQIIKTDYDDDEEDEDEEGPSGE